MRPLDSIRSIKTKIGVVIVAAVGVTIAVVVLGVKAGFPLLVCGLTAGALALAMVQFLARGLTSPLRQMSAAATAMAAGDYQRRVETTSTDEVGELALAFNGMVAELAEVDRIRRDLIANVSHELRTPITALQATLENMVDGVVAPDPPALEIMLQQAQRLGGLVSQLLDLSRLESGVVPLQVQRFRARPFLEAVVREAVLPVAFKMSVEPEDLSIDADSDRLHQVVTNLVKNAARHSPQGQPVGLCASERNNEITIEVCDRGPGISKEESERVFERFYRSDEARATPDGGTGLGLAIARWVIDLHGGSIEVLANSPSGCRMVVTLPMARPGAR